jgi:alpha-ketoglutarate-dependent taurine dioxygenase
MKPKIKNYRNIEDIVCRIDMSQTSKKIEDKLDKVWGKYAAYHIYNVEDNNYESLYENLAEHIGKIREIHASNDKSVKFSKSRDIKPDESAGYHYFSSNTRQPLHSDYAYYEEDKAPDWLLLYCLKPSHLGGKTHILSTKTLNNILEKYNPKLLDKIKVDVNWQYEGIDGDEQCTKPLFDGKFINWNYWQIREELNDKKVMDIRQEFFDFLENFIVAGNIYDYSIDWAAGDCIIFNDRLVLHARDAFLGHRWLKDHAIYDETILSR